MRADFRAGAEAILQAVGHDDFVRLESVGDGSKRAEERAQFHAAALHGVIRAEDEDEAFVLFGADGGVGDEQGSVACAAGDAHAGEGAGIEDAIGIGDDAADLDGSGVDVHAVVHEVDDALVGVTGFIFRRAG